MRYAVWVKCADGSITEEFDTWSLDEAEGWFYGTEKGASPGDTIFLYDRCKSTTLGLVLIC